MSLDSNHRGYPRIFVGGTGRSGTTILYRTLGYHKNIHSLYREMRFIVDPDGLMNLVDALNTHYSDVQSREALYRFERLMRYELTNPAQVPYLSFDIANTLGSDFYWRRLDQFCEDLTEFEYQVPEDKQPKMHEGNYLKGMLRALDKGLRRFLGDSDVHHKVTLNWPRGKVKIPRYFPNRSEIINIAAQFVDDIFMHPTRQNNKNTWCEKTPQNLFHMDFLWELFPTSVFIHMVRDPRGVALSVLNQPWGPHTISEVCIFLQNLYDRWNDVNNLIVQNPDRYLEIKLEDFSASPFKALDRISAHCGLESKYNDLPEIDSRKVNYWRTKLTKSDLEIINRSLGQYITQFGYEL